MIYRQLGKTGLQVSQAGFGCAPLGDLYGGITDENSTRLVRTAIDQGINLFDTSPYYGRTLSETRLGQALVGRRDEVVLATKGGRFDAALETGFDFSYASIMRMCEASLKRLKTDRIDIYQLHDIEFGDQAVVINEGIPALQQLKKDGKVRFIGVTGYPLALLAQTVKSQDLDLTLSYCHYSLLNQSLNSGLVPAVTAKGLGLINASITHMGMLTDQGPQPWHPAAERIKAVARAAALHCRTQGVSLAGLAIQFAFQNPHVDCTLLGPRTEAELLGSLRLLNSVPDPALLAAVQAIIEPAVNLSWQTGRPEHFELGALALEK